MRDRDTYALLEFQGHVASVPIYDSKRKLLRFRAVADGTAPLSFRARGELAKAFRCLLHSGRMVQITASPSPTIVELDGGKKARVVEWEARRIYVLGCKKVKLERFADVRVLDSLMPSDDEIEDVGYVDPESFGRFIARREAVGGKPK